MAVKIANLALTALAAPIGTADTVLMARAGDGALFPVLGDGDWFPLAVTDVDGNTELMRVTGREGDALAVQRAQEGTVAHGFAAGAFMELRMTAAAFAAYAQDLAGGGGPIFIAVNDCVVAV